MNLKAAQVATFFYEQEDAGLEQFGIPLFHRLGGALRNH